MDDKSSFKIINAHEITLKTLHSIVELHVKTKNEIDDLGLALSSTKIENLKLVAEIKRLNKELENYTELYNSLLNTVKEHSLHGMVLDYEELVGQKEQVLQ